MTEFNLDWEEIRSQCIQQGESVRIDKKPGLSLPSYFHETNMGISKGELRQFRDDNPTQSLHIHEFSDHYLAHVDIFNPKFHPLAHGILDTPGITLAIAAGTISAFLIAKTFKDLELVPFEEEFSQFQEKEEEV